jgi:hypothetical protein
LKALKNEILPIIDLNDTENPAVQLALKDVTLTMAYLFNNYEEIVKNKDPLDIQMISIVRNGDLEKLLLNATGNVRPSFSIAATDSNSGSGALTPQSRTRPCCVLM